MKLVKKILYKKCGGAILILCMVFILIISPLAVSMATFSSTNVQLASNQHKVNCAFSSAESGLEVMRYLLSHVTIPNSTPSSNYLLTIADIFQNDLTANDISNISLNYDGSTITLPSVMLASADDTNFEAVVRQLDDNTLQMDVTGKKGQITRTIRVNYNIGNSRHPIFDYGVATKGPLSLTGNARIQGVNNSDEANVYIESLDELLALSMIGNSQIEGDVSIVNSNAYSTVLGNSSIGGETGQNAIDNHVSFGVDSVELPTPDISPFGAYATNIVDASTNTHGNQTFENIRIVAGANPTFSGNIIINGIIFIESPNTVVFTGNTTITGLIVADGNLESPNSSDQIEFRGNLASRSASQLPSDSVFDGLREQTGTFLLAPGFGCSFTGNFNTVNGAIAASGISFTGNANGIITNSVINYSENPMSLTGNARLRFDRSDSVENPAGFESTKILEFQSSTYSELPP